MDIHNVIEAMAFLTVFFLCFYILGKCFKLLVIILLSFCIAYSTVNLMDLSLIGA